MDLDLNSVVYKVPATAERGEFQAVCTLPSLVFCFLAAGTLSGHVCQTSTPVSHHWLVSMFSSGPGGRVCYYRIYIFNMQSLVSLHRLEAKLPATVRRRVASCQVRVHTSLWAPVITATSLKRCHLCCECIVGHQAAPDVDRR